MPASKVPRLKVDEHWFRAQFVQVDLSQAAVARKLGLTPPALFQVLKGKRRLQLAEATKMSQVLGVSLEEVLGAAGIKPTLLGGIGGLNGERRAAASEVPISGTVDADLRITWGSPRGSKSAPLPMAGVRAKDMTAVRYETVGTALDAMDGGLLYFRELKAGIVAGDSVGRLCVVEVADGADEMPGAALVAVVRRGYAAGRFNLVTLAGKVVVENVRIKSASVVIWMKL